MTNQTLTTDSGVICIITKKGTGERAAAGKTVAVHYTGVLDNGEIFDSSLQRGEPISFPLGMGMVIKGWDEGIEKLSVGDRATLVIPSSAGYGERGAGGVIPPNATLIFVVELMSVE